MKPIIRNTCLALLVAALAALLTVAAGAVGSYRTLHSAKSAGVQAWSEVARIHGERARAASAALDAAAQPGGLDPALVKHARQLLAQTTVRPTDSALLNDPRALDAYKQHQGELTGALFRLVGMAQSLPSLSDHEALRELRSALPRDEAALAQARKRYQQAAASYNQEASRFPGVLVTAISGDQALPAGL